MSEVWAGYPNLGFFKILSMIIIDNNNNRSCNPKSEQLLRVLTDHLAEAQNAFRRPFNYPQGKEFIP